MESLRIDGCLYAFLVKYFHLAIVVEQLLAMQQCPLERGLRKHVQVMLVLAHSWFNRFNFEVLLKLMLLPNLNKICFVHPSMH